MKGRVKVTIWVRGDVPVLVDSWYVVFVVFYLSLIDTSRSEYCFTWNLTDMGEKQSLCQGQINMWCIYRPTFCAPLVEFFFYNSKSVSMQYCTPPPLEKMIYVSNILNLNIFKIMILHQPNSASLNGTRSDSLRVYWRECIYWTNPGRSLAASTIAFIFLYDYLIPFIYLYLKSYLMYHVLKRRKQIFFKKKGGGG